MVASLAPRGLDMFVIVRSNYSQSGQPSFGSNRVPRLHSLSNLELSKGKTQVGAILLNLRSHCRCPGAGCNDQAVHHSCEEGGPVESWRVWHGYESRSSAISIVTE